VAEDDPDRLLCHHCQLSGLGRVTSHTARYSTNALARCVAKLDPQQRASLLNHVNTATLAIRDRLDTSKEERDARQASWDAVKYVSGK